MSIAYVSIQRQSKKPRHFLGESERVQDDVAAMQLFVNRMWKQRESTLGKLILFLLVALAIITIFDWRTSLGIVQPIMFITMIVFSFFYIMSDVGEDVEEDELEPEGPKMKALLRLIDYRQHPFSIGLLLFVMIVLILLLAKQYGWMLSIETGGNPLYVMSLPSSAFILSGLSVACALIYLHQQSSFLGLPQRNQGPYKLFQIHFYEIIICGASFFIWLFVLALTWFTG
ncbi:hypothetical protein [Paenibacillus tundrae]